ncbi:protease modulator HflC [Kordiimonas marina]|uniref:protease modulator HflC n=1 Tax=Kordiimonas marina TaxID=2872312 RepID=UPI001FF2797A|nr:protease modulator HflC [Kordiimonas marina]MCJ9427476.1 protease modulator HflC [Kordiimonas marina]
MNTKTLIGLVLLAVLAFTGLSSLYVVKEGEQALVVKFGDPKRTVTEAGLHVKIPFMEQVITLEKRIMSLDIRPQEVLASDQRRLVVDSFARYRIVDPLKRYQAARTETGAASLLENAMESTVREVLAKETMQNIVSGQRAELMQRIRDITNDKAKSFGLEVVDVRLKRVDLPKANSQAIFARMETERKREATEKRAVGQRDAVKIKAMADRNAAELNADAGRKAQIIRGQADAQAVKIFAQAFGKDEDFFEFYRTLQAYKKALNKDNTTLVLSPDSDFLKLFKNGDEKAKR